VQSSGRVKTVQNTTKANIRNRPSVHTEKEHNDAKILRPPLAGRGSSNNDQYPAGFNYSNNDLKFYIGPVMNKIIKVLKMAPIKF